MFPNLEMNETRLCQKVTFSSYEDVTFLSFLQISPYLRKEKKRKKKEERMYESKL